MVKIQDLQKSYGKFRVLNGLNMNISKGEIYGFLGKNGCGKTTTMNILCNVIPKDSGSIILGESEGEEFKIGYLPEMPSLFGFMNGYEYLNYIAACCDYKGDISKRVDEVLDTVGMRADAKRRIKGYSRGMNQRLGIASIIFDNPQLLVLDEPTSALDPEGRADIMNIIRRLGDSGSTIILCTHILPDVEKVADSIGILSFGKIVLEGKISDILKNRAKRQIELRLYQTDAKSIEAVKALENNDLIEKVDFYEQTGCFFLNVRDNEAASGLILKHFSENALVLSYFRAVTQTLEEIYLKAVNGDA